MWSHGGRANGSAPGRIRPGAVLLILVLAGGVYLGIKFLPPFWVYFSMKDPVKEAAMALVSAADEAATRAELIRRAQQAGLTIDDDNIVITRDGTLLVVRVTWVTAVELPRYRRILRFQVEERVPLR